MNVYICNISIGVDLRKYYSIKVVVWVPGMDQLETLPMEFTESQVEKVACATAQADEDRIFFNVSIPPCMTGYNQLILLYRHV